MATSTKTKTATKTKSGKRFVVNALGECFVGNECVFYGSVSQRDVADEFLTPAEFGKWMSGRETKAIKRKMDKAFEEVFERNAKESLTPKQFAQYKLIVELQKINSGDFRVYGGVSPKGKPFCKLVTEFRTFVDDKPFWSELKQVAERLGADILTLDVSPFINKYAPPQGKPGEVILKEYITTNGKRQQWATGKDHGRMEKQVELYWDVQGFTVQGVRDQIKKVKNGLKTVWKKAGVSVL